MMVHMGSLLAIFVYFWRDVLRLSQGGTALLASHSSSNSVFVSVQGWFRPLSPSCGRGLAIRLTHCPGHHRNSIHSSFAFFNLSTITKLGVCYLDSRVRSHPMII
jgi:hypothetical protein